MIKEKTNSHHDYSALFPLVPLDGLNIAKLLANANHEDCCLSEVQQILMEWHGYQMVCVRIEPNEE